MAKKSNGELGGNDRFVVRRDRRREPISVDRALVEPLLSGGHILAAGVVVWALSVEGGLDDERVIEVLGAEAAAVVFAQLDAVGMVSK